MTEVAALTEHDGVPRAAGTTTRMAPMPCPRSSAEQDEVSRGSVPPAHVAVPVRTETATGRYEPAGRAGQAVSIGHPGARAPFRRLCERVGPTAERVAAAARAGLARDRRGGLR
jgi:transketolase